MKFGSLDIIIEPIAITGNSEMDSAIYATLQADQDLLWRASQKQVVYETEKIELQQETSAEDIIAIQFGNALLLRQPTEEGGENNPTACYNALKEIETEAIKNLDPSTVALARAHQVDALLEIYHAKMAPVYKWGFAAAQIDYDSLNNKDLLQYLQKLKVEIFTTAFSAYIMARKVGRSDLRWVSGKMLEAVTQTFSLTEAMRLVANQIALEPNGAELLKDTAAYYGNKVLDRFLEKILQ